MNLLLVEDNPGDAGLLREMLREQQSYDAEVTHVRSLSEAEKHAAGHAVDVILLDLGLPDAPGLNAVRRTRAAAPHVPVVVLTGPADEAIGVQALQEGARDYLIKGQIDPGGLARALRHAIELKRAEAELRDRDLMLRLALDVSRQGVWRWEVGQNTGELDWDERCRSLFGLAAGRVATYAVWAGIVHPEDRVATEASLNRAMDPADSNDLYDGEYRAVHPDGSVRWLAATSRAMFEADPAITSGRRVVRILGTVRDVSELKRAERERDMQNSTQRLLAKVFVSVDDAVTIVNRAGRFVMANPRADQLLGYGPNELVGKISMDTIAPESHESVTASIKKQFEQETDITYVAPVVRSDGSRFVATITSVLVATDDLKQFRILTMRSNEVAEAAIRTESAGRIKLVGLDEVRIALGDRWPAVAERAMATAEAVIKRRCGGQDSFSRVDETSFLMCFGALSEPEATFRAAMIGREIRDRLIGQGSDPDTAYVRSIAAAVRFVDKGETGATLHATILDGLDQQLGRLELDAKRTLQGAMASAACDLRDVSGRNKAEIIATQISLPAELERALVGALSILPQSEAKAFDQDGLLMGLAAQHAIVTMGRGEITPVLVNVRFDVFATRPSTERFLATCLKIDQRVCSRLILLLSSLPAGLPKTRLLECVNRLRPFCRGVGYVVNDPAGLALIDLSNSVTPIVSLPAAVLVASHPDKVKALFSSLHARRAKVLVRGVGTDADAVALRSQGVDMITMGPRPVVGATRGSGALAA